MTTKTKNNNSKKISQGGNSSGIVNFTIGDFLIRIKNACMAGKKKVEAKRSKAIKALADALKKEGLLDEVKEEGHKIIVSITYRNKKPLILGMKLVSTPGLRIYKSVDELSQIKGPWSLIVTTSKGVMSAKEAVKKGIGGEVIAEIL